MDPSPLISPSSDQQFWSALRNRVDTLLEDRKSNHPSGWSSSACGVESECGKRFREDSLFLIRGLDSVASSLSQLTNTLDAAEQGVSNLARPSLTKVLQSENQITEDDEEIQPKAKRRCSFNKFPDNDEAMGSVGQGVGNLAETPQTEALQGENEIAEEVGKIQPEGKHQCSSNEINHLVTGSDELPDKHEVDGFYEFPSKEEKQSPVDVLKSGKLKKAKNLAVSMATKAASLARELKMIKSELCFMQERCTLLEEENRRLRDGFEKGVKPEEDDLVRLQLETLLTEKSRLANENANLTRENQCLQQLVEYHQLTSQDLSVSYDQTVHGMCLDFSSPVAKTNSYLEDDEDNYHDIEDHRTPLTDKLGFSSSVDEQ